MEHYFRTALWIFVLIGCLQAAPMKQDYRFKVLQHVTCPENVTFRSPKNVPDSCLAATVKTISEGLNHAITHCQCSYCHYARDTLKKVKLPPPQNSSECRADQVGSLTFGAFLEEFKDFVERSEENKPQ